MILPGLVNIINPRIEQYNSLSCRLDSAHGKIAIFKLPAIAIKIISLSCLFFLQGCDSGVSHEKADQIKIVQGDKQCALHESYCKDQLVVEVFGPLRKGLLGGEGERNPLKNVKVLFEASGNKGEGASIECENPFTDHGGVVRAKIKTGAITGDNYIKVYPEGNPSISVTARIISGVAISGAKQQAHTDEFVKNPVTVTIQGNNSELLSDVPVYYQLVSAPEDKSRAGCKPPFVLTDTKGEAKTEFKVGSATGIYKVTAEISDPARNIALRGIEISEMGLNVTKLIIVVFGGLAIFIFGMKLMSDGLQIVAGDKMREILKFFTGNRISAVIAGAVVTGVIQSSSATTVMVVGFVNAGIMTLRQAIGVIFGANIGTTMTAQMISFKINDIAFPAIIVGVIIFLFAKKSFLKGWGQALLGFGMLFFGMIIMGDELKKISEFPDFVNFFRTFDCEPINGRMPFLAVLGAIGIGTAMTLVIQSSSATIGIALALASSGLLNFWTAVPLILGDNIGTTITAVLASIGTNERAKQTALAHVLFNVFGVIYMTILFFVPFPGTDIPVFLYLINSITPGDVFSAVPQNIERHIAMAHTMFNVFNVIIFLPFIKYFEVICNKIIVIKDEKLVKTTLLEPHLLESPPAAIQQVILTTYMMLEEACAMVRKAMEEAFFPAVYNVEMAEELEQREKKVDEMQEEATEYLVQLTARQLTEEQAEMIPLLMHCVNDAERIADHAEIIMEFAQRMSLAKNKISEDALEELRIVWNIIEEQAKNTLIYFKNTDIEAVKTALENEKKIDLLAKEYEKNHIVRMKKGRCKVRAGVVYIEILAELEKIGDHLENIAERTPELLKHQADMD